MFALKQNSRKFLAHLGTAVTILVLASACAHKDIAPANNDAAAPAVVTPTPEPMAPVKSEPAAKATAPAKKKKAAKKKAKPSAAHAKKKAHKISRKHEGKPLSAVARVEEQKQPAVTNIEIPVPPPPAIAVDSELDIYWSAWNRVTSYWPYILMGLAVTSIAGAAAYTFRSKPAAKKKGRRLVYNT